MQLGRRTAEDEGLKPIGRVQGALLRIWGPADSWDNPLVGTRYDPALRNKRQHDDLEYRRRRWQQRKQRWDERLHPHAAADRPPAPEHPDE
jgi:hypothetical protein